MAGVALLPHELSGGRLTVRIAWGADLTAAPGTWTFTDVSADVLHSPPIVIQPGLQGIAQAQLQSQPTTMSLTLDGSSGAYTPRRRSAAAWPNVRAGAPIEVLANDGTLGDQDRFTGYIDGIYPSFDKAGRAVTVRITAKGAMSWVQQNDQPVRSVIRRAATDVTTLASVAAYWPCEDGSTAAAPASGLDGGAPAMVTGAGARVSFAADTTFGSSAALPTLDSVAGLRGLIPSSPDTTGAIYFRCLMAVPAGGLADGTVLVGLFTNGSPATHWYLRYGTAGASLQLVGLNGSGTIIEDSGAWAFNVNGRGFYLSIELKQNGSGVDYLFFTQFTDGSNGIITGTFASETLGRCRIAHIGVFGGMSGVVVGHFGVANAQPWLFSSLDLVTGYDGEGCWDRFLRVCAEAGVTGAISTGATTGGRAMGPQGVDTVANLLRACEAVDGGQMVDAIGPARYGVTLYPMDARNNAPVELPLALTGGDVNDELQPQETNQGLVNRATVSRTNGSSATYAQPAGQPYAPDVGVPSITDQSTVSVQQDLVLYGRAAWRVHQSTVDEDRYPGLGLDFRRQPSLAPVWLAAGINSRLSTTGAFSVAAPVTDQIMLGYSEEISTFRWHVTANVAPASPYTVAVVSKVEDFPYAVTNGWPPSWTRTGAGGTVANSDWQASAGSGTMSVPVVSGFRRSYLAGWYPADVDAAASWSLASLPTGGPLEVANIQVRSASASDCYLFRPMVNPGGSVTLQLINPSGTAVGGTVSTGLTYTAGQTWRVHVQAVGNLFRARVWNTSGSEPSTWQLSVTDRSKIAPGYAGIRSGVNGSYSGTLPVVFTYSAIRIWPYIRRKVDTSGSSLHSGVSAGASSMSVDVAGRLWTTTAAQFPFDLWVGGYQVTCTAISGASTPQTFTVDPATVTAPIASGSAVRLWTPATVGLGVM